MIYELRNYDVMPGKMAALNERFANVTIGLFEKHGMKVVGFWTAIVGTSGVLTYMLGFDDFAHREKAWAAFAADPAWQKVFAETEKGGTLVGRITNTILRPTAYSPMK